jgi:hypothetical protein
MSNTIIDEYKKKVKSIIINTYNGKINEQFVDKYVNHICSKAVNKKITANIRNLYEYNYGSQIDANQILQDIGNEKLNILANGLYTKDIKPINYIIIDEWMEARGKYKKQMLAAKEAGNDSDFFYFNNMQNKVKANTNSIYGAATMGSGFISNIDMGGSITAQARNFISEMVWNIERLLGGNYTFENINEVFCWLDMLFKMKDNLKFTHLMKYIDYIPTPEDCRTKYAYITRDIRGFRKDSSRINRTTFLMFDMMEDWKRIFFYYSNNIMELIAKNPKIANIVNKFISYDVDFINPYMFDKVKPDMNLSEIVDMFKNDKNPEEIANFYMDLKLFRELVKTFCMASIIVSNRVIKYQHRRRKVCVIGDTDSTMPSIYEIVEQTLSLFNKSELIYDKDVETRLTMIYVSIISDLMDESCMNFVVCCNQYNKDEKFYMYMKNEFFFPIVLLFNVKKNYIGIQTIQEGKMIPENKQLAITGRALGSAGLNEYVSSEILRIINDDVLKSKDYNPLVVYKEVMTIKNNIKKGLLEGDKTFGVYAKFNGAENIKNPETTSNVRASLIWNDLYVEDYISPGDAIYVFNTTLMSIEDVEKIDDKFSDIKEKLRRYVFSPRSNNLDFSRFGLKTFAMPAYGDTIKIPEWILPFIQIDLMCEKHLQPITSLFPSLLLSPCSYVNEGSNTKKMGISSLIKF